MNIYRYRTRTCALPAFYNEEDMNCRLDAFEGY